MAMYLGEDKVASLGSICNVSGSASKNLFDAYKYSENKTHTGNVSKYSIINHNEIEVSYINGWSRLVLTLTGLEPNTDYTISAYLDKSNFSTSVGSGFYALDNYRDNAFTKGSGNVYFTFTSSSTGTFDMWFYGNWSGTNYSGSIIYQNIQIEKGSTATEYEKYYEPTISVKDSNGYLHEVPYMTGKVSKNLYPSGLTQVFSAPLIKLTKGTYTITEIDTISGNWYFGAYKNGSVLSSGVSFSVAFNWSSTTEVWYRADETLKGFTFTLNEDCEVQIGRLNATGTQKVQLEKGSTATEYEKYFEPTILIRNSNGIFQEVLNNDNLTMFALTAGNNITIDSQYCYKIGKVVHINCSFTPTASIAMWAVVLGGAPPTSYSIPVVASGWTDSVSPVCLYEYDGSIQNRQALTSGRQYRFSMTYIVP